MNSWRGSSKDNESDDFLNRSLVDYTDAMAEFNDK